jgi:hypothetical protein
MADLLAGPSVGGLKRERARIGDLDVTTILRRLSQLEERRINYESHCGEIASRIWPAADVFQTKYAPGQKRMGSVYDATAGLALEKFSAIMESLMVPRQQKWHRIRSTNEALNDDPSVKEWFDEVTRLMFVMRNSPDATFYSQMHEGFKSLGAFGSIPLFLEELSPGAKPGGGYSGGTNYSYIHTGQLYVEVNDRRQVDTVYRKWPMTAHAAYEKWGDLVPPSVRSALAQKPFQEFEFLHAVWPRENVDPEAMGPERLPWRSAFIGIKDKHLIDEGGYHELPYLYSRWTLIPGEIYPWSVAMFALPAVKTANAMQKTFLRSGHKVADPPILAHDESVLGRGSKEILLEPGKVNYTRFENGKPLVAPFVSGARLDLTAEMLASEREVINDSFFVKLFQILVEDRTNMTATEVLQRAQEKGELMAPAVGRQQSELLGPMIHREFNIMARQGLIPPMPPVMLEASGEYEIEYVSPATQFQRAGELLGTQRTMEMAAPFIASDPSFILRFDENEIVEQAQEIHGAPAKILRSREEFEERRREMQEAQKEQEALAAAREGAGALKDAASAAETLQGVEGGASA